MKLGSTLSPKFFDTYRHLPPGIRAKARENYRLFVVDPTSVKFKAIKRLADGNQLCSARVTRDYRVLGVLAKDRDLVLDWVTRPLRAAHQRAAIMPPRCIGNGCLML